VTCILQYYILLLFTRPDNIYDGHCTWQFIYSYCTTLYYYYYYYYVCRRRLPCICWACHPNALACVWAACTGRWTDARAWGSPATGTCTARRRPGERCPRAVSRCAAPAVLDLAHRLLPCTLPIRTPTLRRRDCLQKRQPNDILYEPAV